MTQEEKAKAYDEAIKVAKRLQHDNAWVTTIFPELKENEDEMIRKEIMDFIDTKTIDSDERRNRWFAWLEKQKSKAEQIKEMLAENSGKSSDTCQDKMERLYEKTKDMFYREGVADGILIGKEEQNPAEWSEEDENIKEIIEAYIEGSMSSSFWGKCGYGKREILNWLKSLRPQPKQEWSEEDELRLKSCIAILKASDGHDTINTKWLKSIRPQNQWKNDKTNDQP